MREAWAPARPKNGLSRIDGALCSSTDPERTRRNAARAPKQRHFCDKCGEHYEGQARLHHCSKVVFESGALVRHRTTGQQGRISARCKEGGDWYVRFAGNTGVAVAVYEADLELVGQRESKEAGAERG